MQYWQYPNRVVLGGRISTDLVVKDVKETSKILNFNIANNLNTTGENKNKSGHFFQCEAWGKTAELIEKMFNKGDPIIVEGSLHWTSWQDKNTGNKRDAVRLRVENFYFGGSSPAASNQQTQDNAAPTRKSYSTWEAENGPTAPRPTSAPKLYPVKNNELAPPAPDDDDIPY
jgi:single-strand DNA-binding protein